MTLKSINPSNGEVIGKVTPSSDVKVAKKVKHAKETFPSWKEKPIEERIENFKDLANILEEEKGNFVELINREIGKPDIEAETEVLDTLGAIDYYSNRVRKINEEEIKFDPELFPKTKGNVEFIPYGTLGLITPWNYPLSLPMWTIIPALLTGNTIVFKPSEKSPMVGKKLEEILKSIFPNGVFNVVYGGRDVGKNLVESNIDKLFFTGSISAGKNIQRNIGPKPVNLEMGGNDAALVCRDANLDLTSSGIVWGAINNAGQVCTSIERVYVMEDIYDGFIEKLKEDVNGLEAGKDYGPLIDGKQLNKVKNQINDALSKGANLIAGGNEIDGDGFFFEPTILEDVNENMKIMREETFGPTLPLKKVQSEEEAVQLANSSDYGLGVTIWTDNVERGKKIGKQVNSGMVWINDVNLPLPGGDYWGGTKESGLRNAQDNLKECLKSKSYVTYSGNKERDWWYPY